MSWGFSFVAKDKVKAQAQVTRAVHQHSLPPSFAAEIKERIEAMPEPAADRAILVESNGHYDGPTNTVYGHCNGEGKFRITLITFLASLVLALFAPPAAAQEGPKFGGCIKDGKTCFGPTVSVNVVAVNLKTGNVTSTFDPGIGYGVTFFTKEWYRTGVAGAVAFPLYADARRIEPSLLVSFAEYIRIGYACPLWTSGGLKENSLWLLSFGSDFGK